MEVSKVPRNMQLQPVHVIFSAPSTSPQKKEKRKKKKEMSFSCPWLLVVLKMVNSGQLCYRKRRGLKPTGMLVHAAKATGFSSVSELLDAKGPEACQQLIVKNKTASSAEV